MLAGTSDPHMLLGRGLGHPKPGPMGAPSSSEPAASLFEKPRQGLPSPSLPPAAAALWPEPGRHFSPSLLPLPLLRPTEIYSRPGSPRSEQGGLREALMGHNGWGGCSPGACPARTPPSIRSCGRVSANEAPPLPLGASTHRTGPRLLQNFPELGFLRSSWCPDRPPVHGNSSNKPLDPPLGVTPPCAPGRSVKPLKE